MFNFEIQRMTGLKDPPISAQYFGHAGSSHVLSVQPVRQYQFFLSTSALCMQRPFVRQRSPIMQHVEWPPASTAVMLHGTWTSPSHVVSLPTVLKHAAI